jgi:hypothetical protein
VLQELQVTRVGRNVVLTDLLTIALCGVAVGIGFFRLYPPADSWDGLIARAAGSALLMLAAVLAISGRLRSIVLAELRMTMRSFLTRPGV